MHIYPNTELGFTKELSITIQEEKRKPLLLGCISRICNGYSLYAFIHPFLGLSAFLKML